MNKLAVLVLENGIIFHGTSLGVDGYSVGEVVFNTSMTGYQEIITDPSYSHQIVTLTFPHIGNTGTNLNDIESNKIHIRGLIVRDLSLIASNYSNQKNFKKYLKTHNVITMTNVDTRKLTRILRQIGSLKGCIYTLSKENYYSAYQKSIAFSGLKGIDLVRTVTTKKIYHWNQKHINLKKSVLTLNKHKPSLHIVVYDFGVKRNILQSLANRNCHLTIVPASTTAKTALKLLPDGIFLSNGPGDPEPCLYAIKTIQNILKNNIPIFGICLGHQLLALASGAKIIKMKCGHHGSNHPVKNLITNKVIITSQNHGFTVDINTLPSNLEITHISLFDGTIQGLQRKDISAFSFQGHPEASPGPHDSKSLFDIFIKNIQNNKKIH